MGGPGYPSGPERGLPPKLAGRGQASGAKSPRVATSPEERTGVLRRRGGAPRGVAVCLYLPAIRETSRGCYQVAPFGASASLSFKESEGPEPLTHVKQFAGGDDACPNQGECTWLTQN